MRFLNDCPSLESWKRFLKESLPSSLRTNLAQHLDSCLHCQATVDRLCKGGVTWLEVAKRWQQGSPGLSPATSDNRTDNSEEPSALGRLPKQSVPTMIAYACPRCSTILRAEQDQAGSKHDCPSCGQRLQVPAQGNKTVLGDPVPEVPRGTQKALVACPACGKQVSRHATACPHCGQPIRHSVDPGNPWPTPNNNGGSVGFLTKSLPVIAMVFLFVTLSLCCGGVKLLMLLNQDIDSTHGADTSDPSRKYEAAIKEMISILTEYVQLLEGVKDNTSARQAAFGINKLNDRLIELGKRMQKFPGLTKSQQDTVDMKYRAEMDSLTQRAFQAGASAGMNTDDKELGDALVRFEATAKAVEKLAD